MELFFLAVRIVEWVIIEPVWWLANNLAGCFYPYEGDGDHFTLSLLFAFFLGAGACWLLWYFLI